jgi:hypothetical protein
MRDLYRARTSRSPLDGECLATEVLVGAATGELSARERERVADHLIACSSCAEEYRIIRPLETWAEGVALHESAELPSRRSRLESVFALPRVAYAIAAVLLILSAALGIALRSLREDNRLLAGLNEQLRERDRAGTPSSKERIRQVEQHATQIAELQQRINELSQPQMNLPIRDLDPQGSTRGQSRRADAVIELPSSASLFALILNVGGEVAHSSYALEIMDGRGKTVWSGGGLQKSPYNTFTVALSRRLLPAGRYRIKLYGTMPEGRKQLVEDYAVRIVYQ